MPGKVVSNAGTYMQRLPNIDVLESRSIRRRGCHNNVASGLVHSLVPTCHLIPGFRCLPVPQERIGWNQHRSQYALPKFCLMLLLVFENKQLNTTVDQDQQGSDDKHEGNSEAEQVGTCKVTSQTTLH